jgi:tRNA A-37 threonylcarbamoyl transferase component Bud32/tetratricopeptide (TPR) repeat protein
VTDLLPHLRLALEGRYVVERELGRGGMAIVYLAQDLKHQRKVAIKVLRPELAASLGAERFVREIGTMGNLRHPHILPLYDSGEAEGFLFFVMPLIEGETLRDRLDSQGQLPIDDTLRITREVAEALGYAHAQGVVHRDIKPENILLEQGHAVLADFGIARAVGTAGGERLTASGLSIGTPAYMSPEQGFGEGEVDGRTDLYSLGCVMYEMLGGEPPYTGPTPQAIIAKRMALPVPRVRTLRETVPAELDAAITRLLAKSAADRYPTAAALLEALDGRETVPAAPTPVAAVAKRWDATRLIAAALVVAGLAFGWRMMSRGGGAAAVERSADLMAVVPFSVRGSDAIGYLGEGIVDLMSAKLDGAGPLRVVNPRAVIAMVNGEGVDVQDPVAGGRVAERFGAGRYVTGDVTEVAGQVQFTARLYRGGDPDASPVATATATGRVEAIFDLVDSLAFTLLAGTMADSAGYRLPRVAAATTGNFAALKAYLEGERFIRRGGQYREAAEAYQRAIAIDTAFALAYYRKSLVGDWVDAFDVRSSAERAMEYADRLSPRDRSLLAALVTRRQGHSDAAEEAYRAHLVAWPDEVEALIQLGEILFHDGPRRGQSMNAAMPVYERALELEPGNVDARVHLSRLYALNEEYGKLAEDVRQFERYAASAATEGDTGRGGERLFETQSLLSYATHDSAGIAEIGRELLDKPWYFWFYAAHGASRFARNPAGAQAMLAQRTSDEPLLLMLVANLQMVRGQTAAFREFVADPPGAGRSPLWDLLEAFVWTSGAIAPDTTRMELLVERLRNADPAQMRRQNWVEAYEDLTDDFHRFERDHMVAMLLIHLGRPDEARPIIASLRSRESMEQLGNLQADAIRSLEAEMAMQAGNSTEALRILRTITYETPHASTYHAFADASRPRFLQAELELAQGDTAVAVGLYRGFDESWSPWDTYHRAIAYQRLGEVAEAQGRRTDAIRYYGWLLELWRDADADYDDRRAAIGGRREALLREQG